MARARSPNSIEAEEMYKNGMKLVDIAKKLDVPASTVRRWKSTQNWDGKTKGKKNERSQKKKANARHKGGQPGNRNAVGNKGGPLKPGDKIAEKHGAYSAVYWDVLDEDNMLFIVDEASGVADPIMEAILGTLSGSNNKLLLCGNPTRTSGTFYDSHTRDRALYKCHTVSSADSSRTNKENIDSLIRKYGWDSNVVRVRVRGEFPNQEDDVFIPLSLIEQCSSKLLELDDSAGMQFVSLGVDVARFGDDETIIYRNYHGHCKIVRNRRGQNLMATVGDIVKEFKKIYREYSKYEGKVYVQIDDTGLGGGVTDRLKEVRKEQKLYKMQIIPINAAEKIETDTAAGKDAAEKYNNLTTAMWASMRDLLDNKQIVIEDDEQTIGQLSSRKYTMTSNGKLEIESKKEMKKRGLDSPDRADALALALYLGKIKKHTGTAPGVKELQELTKDNYWG